MRHRAPPPAALPPLLLAAAGTFPRGCSGQPNQLPSTNVGSGMRYDGWSWTGNVYATDMADDVVTLGPWVNFLTDITDGGEPPLDNPVTCDLDGPGSMMLKDPPTVTIGDPCSPTSSCQMKEANMTFTPAPNVGGVPLPAVGKVMCYLENDIGEKYFFDWTITIGPTNTPPTVTVNNGVGYDGRWDPNARTITVFEDNSRDPRSPDLSDVAELGASTVTLSDFFDVSPSTPAVPAEPLQYVRTRCEVIAGSQVLHQVPEMVSRAGSQRQHLKLTLARDQSGTATVVCTHSDQDFGNPSFSSVTSQSTQTTMTLVVKEVNDLPVAEVLNSPLLIMENDLRAPHESPGVIRLRAGPEGATELATQTVCGGGTGTCTCSASAPSLFEQQPRLSSDGTVLFVPGIDKSGGSSVSCTIRDNGSPPQQASVDFQIDIVERNDPPRGTVTINGNKNCGNVNSNCVVVVTEDTDKGVEGITVLTDVYPYGVAAVSESSQLISKTKCDTSNNAVFTNGVPPELIIAQPQGGDGKLRFGLKPHVNTEGREDLLIRCLVYDNVDPPAVTEFTFKMRIRAVNDPPELSVLQDTVLVKQGLQRIIPNFLTATPGAPDEMDQLPLDIECVPERPQVFAAGNTPTISQDGTLMFAAGPAAMGESHVTCTAADKGAPCPDALDPATVCVGTLAMQGGGCLRCSASVTFEVQIDAVNQPPSFTLVDGGRVMVAESGKAEAVTIMRDILPGPPGEVAAGQIVEVSCGIPSRPDMFAVNQAPRLGNDGVLRFTTVDNVQGDTTVSCTVQDSGSPPLATQADLEIIISPLAGGGTPPSCRLVGTRPGPTQQYDLTVKAVVGVTTEVPDFMEVSSGLTRTGVQTGLEVDCAPDNEALFHYQDELAGREVGKGEDPVTVSLRGWLASASFVTRQEGTAQMICTITDGSGQFTTCSFTVLSAQSGGVGGTLPPGGSVLGTPGCSEVSVGQWSAQQQLAQQGYNGYEVRQFMTLAPGVTSVRCDAQNRALFTAAGAPSIGVSTGSLRFTPVRAVTGRTPVQCSVTDGPRSSQTNFVISIVNGWDGRFCPGWDAGWDPTYPDWQGGVPAGPAGGNAAPCWPACTVVQSPVVVATDSGPYARAGFVTGLRPGPPSEDWQTLSVSCQTTRMDLFLAGSQPRVGVMPGAGQVPVLTPGSGSMAWGTGAVGTLNFVPAAGAAGTARVQCTATDNGTPRRSASFAFDIQIGNVGLPVARPAPVCAVSQWGQWGPCSATCGGGTQTRQRSVVNRGGQLGGTIIGGVPVGWDGGTAVGCPALTDARACGVAACTGAQCLVSGWGAYGACDRTCGGGTRTRVRTVTNPGGYAGAACPALTETAPCSMQACPTPYVPPAFVPAPYVPIVPVVVAPVPVAMVAASGGQLLRLVLSMPLRDFRAEPFEEALRDSVPYTAMSFKLHWACPSSACPGLQCPATNAQRRAAGCRDSSEVQCRRRSARALQGGGETVVDFDLPWNGDAGLSPIEARQRVLADLQAELARCRGGGACALRSQRPASASLAPATDADPAPARGCGGGGADDEDDSSLSPGLIALVVVAAVLCCCILAVAAYLATRKKDKKGDKIGEQKGDMKYGKADAGGPGSEPSQQDWANKSAPPAAAPSPHTAYSPTSHPQSRAPAPYSVPSGGPLEPGRAVLARYNGDMELYEGTVHSFDPDGTYTVNWFDGTHTTGVPPQFVHPH